MARDPLSVVVVTSKVAAESWVDATVVVHCAVQNVRKHTALGWNGCGVVAFIQIAFNKFKKLEGHSVERIYLRQKCFDGSLAQ